MIHYHIGKERQSTFPEANLPEIKVKKLKRSNQEKARGGVRNLRPKKTSQTSQGKISIRGAAGGLDPGPEEESQGVQSLEVKEVKKHVQESKAYFPGEPSRKISQTTKKKGGDFEMVSQKLNNLSV